MKLKTKFWKWTLLFGALGLLDPVLSCIHWFLFGGYANEFEFIFWPSSIMFMGLEGPTPIPKSTIVEVYALAMIVNVVIYAIVGAFTWLLVKFVFWLRTLLGGRAKSL